MNQKAEAAYIGLGSNMGDRRRHLSDAVDMLKNTGGVVVEAVSPVYKTKPVGYTEQPEFLNCAVKIKTTLTPYKLLESCMSIEKTLKRDRAVRWGPRTADLDILFFGSHIIDRPGLTIPHPRIQERAFVLVPMADIEPDMLHPKLNATVRQLLERLEKDGTETDGVKKTDD